MRFQSTYFTLGYVNCMFVHSVANESEISWSGHDFECNTDRIYLEFWKQSVPKMARFFMITTACTTIWKQKLHHLPCLFLNASRILHIS